MATASSLIGATCQQDARRLPLHAGMDLGLAVGSRPAGLRDPSTVGHVTLSASAANLTTTTPDPTPEYIARLLEQDLDGADEGYDERVERLEHDQKNRVSPPAGNEGPTSRVGGGRAVGDQEQRVESELTDPEPTPPPKQPVDAPDLVGDRSLRACRCAW